MTVFSGGGKSTAEDWYTMHIRQLHAHHELNELEALQIKIWHFEPASITPSHVFIAAVRSGGLVLGAYNDDHELVGFSLAFRGERNDEPCLYSHLTGVLPDLQGKGLGFELKLHQREFALKTGLRSIVWTFDPLMTPNARLNIQKLGGVVYRYIPNAYGDSAFRLYGDGFPTHRYELHWHLERELPSQEAMGPNLERADRANVPYLIKPSQDGVPVVQMDALEKARGVSLVMPVPRHHLRMRKENPELARCWQVCVSSCSERLIGRSHFVSAYEDLEDGGIFIFDPLDDSALTQ